MDKHLLYTNEAQGWNETAVASLLISSGRRLGRRGYNLFIVVSKVNPS